MQTSAMIAQLKQFQAPLAVACSGGLDSIALLHAAGKAGLSPIALHVDHGIHPDSAAWALQVQATAKQFGAGFASERVTGLSGDMPSLENAARNARHAALARLCDEHGIKTLLLAHHANDQAETVLLNLLRGTGLGGVGMPQSRIIHNKVGTITWLRPWLHVPRKDIETYAAQHGLTWVEDPSNTDETLRRNAVRHTLWPVVQAVEPRALPSLARFADIALEASNTELALAQLCLKPHLKPDNGVDWYALSQAQTMTVQASLLRAWLASLGCKPPTQARLRGGMLAQLNARTGDGLRCSHAGWDFVYADKILFARVASHGTYAD